MQKKSSVPDRWLKLLKIAWPLIIANSFWNLQLTIDRIYLGSFSTEALGAAMAVMGVFWTPMALLQQTAAYLMTFVAQYFGAKRENMIGPAVWQAIYICLAGGLLFLLFIPTSELLFSFIGHSPKLQSLESDYFIALCYSAMPTALVAAASGFFTGLGQTKIIMRINCIGLIANVILDYIMIFGKFGCPPMGITGAGYATAAAGWVSAFYALHLLFSQENEFIYKTRSGYKYSADLMRRFLKYGLPSGMQWALEGLAFTVFLALVGKMVNGEAALASSSIAVTIMMLAILPALGIAQAVSILVGQHLGEKKPERAYEDTWTGVQVAAIYIAMAALSFVLVPKFYLSWFHNESNPLLWSQVEIMVPVILMFVASFTLFDSMNLVFSFALKGAGDTRYVTLMALTMPWPLMVLPAWLLKDHDQAVYLAWGAASVYIICLAMVFLHRFLGGKWKQMSVIN